MECITQHPHGRNQRAFDLLHRGNMHYRREHIIRGLAAVYIIVRMDGGPVQLHRPIRDHLVGVHVGLRAGASLEYDQRKLGIPCAVDHFLCGAYNQLDFFERKLTQFAIGQRCAFLHDSECPDNGASPAKSVDANRKVFEGALGLRAPQVIGGYRNRSQRVVFPTNAGIRHSLSTA